MAKENTKVNMKKRTKAMVLIAVAITACIVGIVIKFTSETTSWGPLLPNFKEMEEKIVPKFEEIEIKINESATLKAI